MKNFCISLFILLMSLVGSFSIAANKNVQDAVAKIQAQTAKDIGAVGIEGYFGKRGGSDVFYPEDFKYIKSLIIKNPEALPKGFDYIIGSVHHVNLICIDASPELTEKAIKTFDDLESFAIEYYKAISRMVEALKPEIVGHIDLIKKFAAEFGNLDTPKIKKQMKKTLSIIKKYDCTLDLNVYPFRIGQSEPYPAPWIIKMANDMGIPFSFGDDSHSPATVGEGILEGRNYLLANGADHVIIFKKHENSVIKQLVSLKS